MNFEADQSTSDIGTPKPTARIFLIIALFGPSVAVLYSSHLVVAGILLILPISFAGGFQLGFTPFEMLPFALFLNGMRFVFVFQLVRYYNGSSSWNRTIFVGLLSEMVFVTLGIVDVIFSLPFGSARTGGITLPLPVLLVLAWMIMKFYPPRPLAELGF
ncbi:MAG: hypothetical protein ACFFD9_08415 [Candidatus Thorarchaeota archaeon]